MTAQTVFQDQSRAPEKRELEENSEIFFLTSQTETFVVTIH